MICKKGVFFSTDALIALIIIFLSILVLVPFVKYAHRDSFIQSDVKDVLTSLKIGEIDNVYVQELIAQGRISDLNKSVLEQIGEFYITDLDVAKNLGDEVLDSLESNENIGIWYENTLIVAKNTSPIEDAQNIEVDSQIISGIQEGESVTGFSGRAFLLNSVPKKYFYFGGYVGDGNISININGSGEVEGLDLEVAINKDFDIYLNDIFSGHYENASSNFVPANYDLSAYVGNMNPGENTIEFRGDNLHIAGGYVKVTYSNSSLTNGNGKYHFPGIEGLINIYDGLYVPGNLTDMEIFLHFNNNLTTFLNIGNVTVFNGSTSGEESFTINNSYLSSRLDYDSLSETTIPLRLGLEGANYTVSGEKDADVFSVTDISGSMGGACSGYSPWYCCWWGADCGTQSGCEDTCGGTYDGGPLEDAKEANKVFINAILNNSNNRVGLVAYQTDAYADDFHELSNDNESLIDEVEEWESGGGTCICCGINEAVEDLVDNSDPSKFRSIVVMSDGEATRECNEQGNTPDLNGNGQADDAGDDAIQAACDAYNDHDMRIYAVGFGGGADEDTLEGIANCGNGTYHYGDVDSLIDIYKLIAEEIIDVAFSEQTTIVSSNLFSKLYPDSYISFDYEAPDNEYGLITINEEGFSDSYEGYFEVPDNSSVSEARVISYSGSRWTDNVDLNGNSIYDLSNYGSDYVQFGDPYAINLPSGLVESNNTVRVTTGLSPDNSSEGSIHNKIIYNLVRNFVAYSSISSFSEGCSWYLEFEDDSNLTVSIPLNYSGSNSCEYSESVRAYDVNDAIQSAVYNLLELLDFYNDGKLDVKFTEQDFAISSSQIIGIPYGWSSEIQIRRWY
ncbi:VWA domain-containing protein [archaeon]|jgi:hypothetical protein|nr:VWA domain-containing protein [archaeon]MBT4241624.1 VWA domain-containing protein [archaeon]MBT4418019.1 VWA domain-containing protein [archaeon]